LLRIFPEPAFDQDQSSGEVVSHHGSVSIGEHTMPREVAIVIIAIVAPFIIFAATLAWADFRTRDIER
jgi:hypothetical protein